MNGKVNNQGVNFLPYATLMIEMLGIADKTTLHALERNILRKLHYNPHNSLRFQRRSSTGYSGSHCELLVILPFFNSLFKSLYLIDDHIECLY